MEAWLGERRAIGEQQNAAALLLTLLCNSTMCKSGRMDPDP